MIKDSVSVYVFEDSGIVRYRPLMKWIEVTLLLIGAAFWVESTTSDNAFNRMVFGGIAYALPAWFWAAIMMGASALTINGLLHPIHYKRVVVGAAIHATQFTALAYSATVSHGQFVVVCFYI